MEDEALAATGGMWLLLIHLAASPLSLAGERAAPPAGWALLGLRLVAGDAVYQIPGKTFSSPLRKVVSPFK